jgi:hypothetical protein
MLYYYLMIPRPASSRTPDRSRRHSAWARSHPRLYAARHVVVAVAEIAAGLVLARIALGFVLDLGWGWLPDWHLPRIPRPDLPWPDLSWPNLPWPDVELPDWSLPGWLAAVLATKRYWFPVLVAIAVALAEIRRRERRQADPEDEPVVEEDAAWPAPSTPSDTQRGASSSSTPR